jgi:hypothetical protein
LGADVALGEAALEVDGAAEVLALDVGAPDVDGVDVEDVDGLVVALPAVEPAGDWVLWKSVQVSVRKVSPFEVTLNAVGVTVYFTPSLLTT